MEIKCPHCDSRFNLPDAAAKPGAKLRCSVCHSVFALSAGGDAGGGGGGGAGGAGAGAPLSMGSQGMGAPFSVGEEEPRGLGRRRKILLAAIAVLSVVLLAGVAWQFVLPFFGLGGGGGGGETPVAEADQAAPPPAQPEDAGAVKERIRPLSMKNVTQYFIDDNEAAGKIFVVSGEVVNGSDKPKSHIYVKADIYDANSRTIQSKRQAAGTQLSLFQLQVMDTRSMESFLNNPMEIMTNNTNIPPGGEVPFMLVFYPPSKAEGQAFADRIAEWGVYIVDVQDD